ncbi:MAG: winged helix-turn-helix transcriptional regulator [Opitutales bacterium]|nr:winged helix-turn-helix transcriptional regulator [Opitutales bacterium]
MKGSLSEEALELVARRFSVLGEPMRLRLLHALMEGERNVTALVEATGGQQANVSRHLQTLAQAGFVRRRRAGLQAYYSIADPDVFQLCDIVCGGIEKHLSSQARAMPGAAEKG